MRKRFCEEELERALNERPRLGQKRKLSGRQDAHLVAKACSDPPEGHTHWTRKLLAESISPKTVRQMLKKRAQAVDFADQMRWLVDEAYPEVGTIRLVLDNLNIHKFGSLYEAFKHSEARRMARRLELHHSRSTEAD